MPEATKPAREPLSTTLRADLLQRLEEESDQRQIGRPVLMDKAVELLLAALPPVPALFSSPVPVPDSLPPARDASEPAES